MNERMPRRQADAGMLAAMLVASAVAGCTATVDDPPATVFVTPTPPGGGSEADGSATAPAESETTTADLAFVEAMIAHHDQAVELAELALDRAADGELIDLASRMRAAQAAEADAMRSWLERRRARELTTEDHGHEAMRGEISRSTLDRAAELDGAVFDELFIAAMVPHHRGAIEMADARLAVAGDPAVARWARAIATSQSLEIDRLLEIEARLSEG